MKETKQKGKEPSKKASNDNTFSEKCALLFVSFYQRGFYEILTICITCHQCHF
jgi:hypothetical protein